METIWALAVVQSAAWVAALMNPDHYRDIPQMDSAAGCSLARASLRFRTAALEVPRDVHSPLEAARTLASTPVCFAEMP